jgi:predicted Fe-Mo cluster-binding NifX family protein
MKIAVPSDDQITISQNIENANGFVIINYESGEIGEYEYRKNNRENKNQCSIIKSIIKDCNVVISHKMNKACYNDLQADDVEIYITDKIDVIETVRLFITSKKVMKNF